MAGKAGAHARWHAPKPDPLPETVYPPTTANGDDFLNEQLVCVREQIELMNGRILELITCKEDKSQSIDRLASAVSRLRESERILRNQPLPGSYKPVAQRAKRSYQHTEQPSNIETRNSVEPTSNSVPPQSS